ncbi:MAG: DNA polymerase III subunit alpha [bacterium]|nr:DNA polymerase III subunit alpha [bacterium]
MEYVSLHTHTTFSLLDSYGTPEQYVARAKELGHKALAITEHGNTSSHPKLEQACKEHGIKPIYGCEFYMGEHKQKDKNHITVLAKNEAGYANLLKLSSLAYTEDRFYYQPAIRLTDLLENQENLIILSGCQKGLITQKVLQGDMEGAKTVAEKLNKALDHFYIEIQPLTLEESKQANRGLIAVAQELNIPLVATNDVHYLEPGDEQVQWFLSSIRRRKNVYDDWGTMDKRCYLATGEEMLQWGSPVEAVRNTARIADMVEAFELPKAEPVRFGIDNPYKTLVDWCRKGWKKRGIPKPKWDEYRERLFRELDLIKDKDYVDYFLVVADMVQWAKDQGIMVGPARGSVAGSLTAYLLGITEVDPIKWDLLFERFIDVSRYDPPDIDLDFQDDRREEVKEYLRGKYGLDRVANIAGYSMFKPKSLLDDIGRVLKIPKAEIEEAKNELIENGGTKDVDEIIRERWEDHQYLAKVEGMVRQLTVHAAGVIVASDKLEKFTTLGKDGIMLDHRDAEYLGLMKIDVLSLRTLTILDKCLKAIGKDSEWLYNDVPLDDEATYRAFSTKAFQGIFQFEGATTRRVCQQVKPSKFEELIDINALSRPGPLQSGATEAYINGWVDDIDPIVTKYTARSRGQILFQEQIMKILREAGKLDWADVTAVRKLITKKQGAEKLVGIKERFLQAYSHDQELGEEIWHRCGESGAYGFNIAHSTSYTFLGYYCMYLKVHHPLEFYWANLVVEPDNESLLREYIQAGGKVYNVKFGRSKATWTIDKGGLRAGYLTLHGIGLKNAEKLESGEEPEGKIRQVLEDAGAFEPEQGESDYLGLEALKERLDEIPERDTIDKIKPGEYVRIAGKVLKLQVKNLREVIESQGREYDVRDPEHEKYVHLEIGDETGIVNVTINRYKYADITLQEELAEINENSIVVITGEYNKQYQKIYAARVRVM